jgi:hypothetical protein
MHPLRPLDLLCGSSRFVDFCVTSEHMTASDSVTPCGESFIPAFSRFSLVKRLHYSTPTCHPRLCQTVRNFLFSRGKAWARPIKEPMFLSNLHSNTFLCIQTLSKKQRCCPNSLSSLLLCSLYVPTMVLLSYSNQTSPPSQTLAAAIPTGTPPPPVTPPSSPQCCYSVVPSNSTTALAIAALLGIDLTGLDVPIGALCSSITGSVGTFPNWYEVPRLLIIHNLT